MTPLQQAILREMKARRGWIKARELRDRVCPTRGVKNIHVSVHNMRFSLPAGLEIESEAHVGPASRGYRVVRA